MTISLRSSSELLGAVRAEPLTKSAPLRFKLIEGSGGRVVEVVEVVIVVAVEVVVEEVVEEVETAPKIEMKKPSPIVYACELIVCALLARPSNFKL